MHLYIFGCDPSSACAFLFLPDDVTQTASVTDQLLRPHTHVYRKHKKPSKLGSRIWVTAVPGCLGKLTNSVAKCKNKLYGENWGREFGKEDFKMLIHRIKF
ncbi:hypothetical protein ATANTOWER_028815 [Ataeniobius toweri]|uniref:Uncharacterized protein n=1 Tax=Ataeniobius toweri TaxID=208326 RepID=A0ABU7AT14_9TELE|nr:hypothetical protein [Ataeniobius toweri]